MSGSHDDRYLWDRSGPRDAEIGALEDALGRLGYDGRPFVIQRTRRRRVWLSILAAAIVLVTVGGTFWWLGGSPPPGVPELVADGRPLSTGQWVSAQGEQVLSLGSYGTVTLADGARLQVRELREDLAQLHLASGRLHAFIAADVRPRFFQVSTPSAICVDLGCRYDLTVDDRTGDAHVVVTLGQVAFETDGGAIFVPRGAEARAFGSQGLGTPRFSDTPEAVGDLLDAYDVARDSAGRRDVAAEVCRAATALPDTLFLWHMLRDSDPEVAARAEAALVRLAGAPPDAPHAPPGLGADVWREHVEWMWWR